MQKLKIDCTCSGQRISANFIEWLDSSPYALYAEWKPVNLGLFYAMNKCQGLPFLISLEVETHHDCSSAKQARIWYRGRNYPRNSHLNAAVREIIMGSRRIHLKKESRTIYSNLHNHVTSLSWNPHSRFDFKISGKIWILTAHYTSFHVNNFDILYFEVFYTQKPFLSTSCMLNGFSPLLMRSELSLNRCLRENKKIFLLVKKWKCTSCPSYNRTECFSWSKSGLHLDEKVLLTVHKKLYRVFSLRIIF